MVFFTSRGLTESGVSIGDIDVGTEILLNESGTPVNYLIVNQGKPGGMYDESCDGTWCLRKDIAEKGRPWNSVLSNVLETSEIHEYLNGDWMNRYDPDVAEAIKQIKIPYCVGGGSATVNSGALGLSCKCFLLSMKEVGLSHSNAPNDGSKLDYFSDDSTRISMWNGTADSWWLRSAYIDSNSTVYIVAHDGSTTFWNANSPNYCTRPALILPYDFKLTDDQIVS